MMYGTRPRVRLVNRAGTEAITHRNVCDYLHLQYPGVLFRTDFAAGVKMTPGQASQHKRLQHSRAWPDLFIAEPRGGYAGLFLELKREGTRVFLKDGSLSRDEHIQEQAACLRSLSKLGYRAHFAIGFEAAKSIIDEYLLLPVTHV